MSESARVQTRAVTGDEAGLRLDRWFQRHFPQLSHGALQKLLRTGQVRLDGKRVEGKDRVEPGQTVRLPPGVTAKDLVLGAIGQIGVSGGQGYAVEYAGAAIEALSMEGRMTVCNMSIEWGARAGMVAPDETTFAYLRARGVETRDEWHDLYTDPDARFDRVVTVDVGALVPQVTWGTNPAMVAPVDGVEIVQIVAVTRRESLEKGQHVTLELRLSLVDIDTRGGVETAHRDEAILDAAAGDEIPHRLGDIDELDRRRGDEIEMVANDGHRGSGGSYLDE